METIRRRLEFVLVLTLFFPVIVDALFKDNTQESGDVTLRLGLAVSCLILSFLILELYMNGVHKLTETILKWTLLLEIFSFVPVLFLLSIYQGETILQPVIFFYQTSLIGIYLLPFLVLLILIVQLVFSLDKVIQSKLSTLKTKARKQE